MGNVGWIYGSVMFILNCVIYPNLPKGIEDNHILLRSIDVLIGFMSRIYHVTPFDCFSCLDPKNSFSKFDVDKLARLADIYHADFSDDDRGTIRDQLETYVLQVRRNASFSTCEDVQSLAMKMVQTEKHLVFPLVYKLIELALILPVSTASVERAFSAMKIIKSKLRNKINDVWFNDLMVCYTEREIFKSHLPQRSLGKDTCLVILFNPLL
ncbi:hypothetical protein GmHk_12G034395 [Glycine max]|nr:hypothetical protein GmHk_12G034395 [Glycine max]